MHQGIPHTEPLNWQWMNPFSGVPTNILSRYLPQPVQSPPFLGGGLDMLPVNQVNNVDPGTMYPVNQLPRLPDPPIGSLQENNNPVTSFGFPTRYIYPDKTTGTVPRPSGITGIRPRRSDREPILEGNNPIVNTGLPTGHMGPLPPRAAPFQGSLMEGNNPPVPAPGPEGVGGFAHFMRTRGTPLSNDQLINAQIALGLGLGLR